MHNNLVDSGSCCQYHW